MHGEDRRQQLLDVAVDVFARQGFGGTKTKDIAAAAGVSEAIVFRHFSSKEDLYHAILDAKEDKQGAPEFVDVLRTFADRRDDAGLFHYVGSAIMRSFRDDPAFHRLMLYASLEGHLLAGLFHERFGLPIFDFLRRYVALRQKEGAFRAGDPQVGVMFLTGSIMHFAMVRHVFQCRKPPVSEEGAVKEMVAMALAGLTSGCNAVRGGKPKAAIRGKGNAMKSGTKKGVA
jgi:TetR/AcrR family transcriptional regulator